MTTSLFNELSIPLENSSNNTKHNFLESITIFLNSDKYKEEFNDYFTKQIPIIHKDVALKTIFSQNINSQTINESSFPVDIDSYNNKLKIIHIARHKNYLENCGCKTNQNGGIARLYTFVNERRKANKDILLLNLGDNLPVEKHEMELKEFTKNEVQTGFELLKNLRFDAINVRITELFYTPEFFISLLKKVRLPYINGNILHNGQSILPSHQIVTKQGLRIGIFGITEPSYFGNKQTVFEDNTYFLKYKDTASAISQSINTLRKIENVDFVIMLCNFDFKRLEVLSKNQNIDLIITATIPSSTHHQYGKTYFMNNSLVIHSDLGSYGIIESDIYLKNHKIISAESKVIQLDESIKDDQYVRSYLDNFYLSLASEMDNTRFISLWEEEAQHANFVGANKCQKCHISQFNQWKTTAHSLAFSSLVKRHRNYFPNCVQCHVTGYELNNGFSLAKASDKNYQNVQCESCHGPGSDHIINPLKNNLLKLPNYGLCVQCHSEEHSDMNKNNFNSYISKVIHNQ